MIRFELHYVASLPVSEVSGGCDDTFLQYFDSVLLSVFENLHGNASGSFDGTSITTSPLVSVSHFQSGEKFCWALGLYQYNCIFHSFSWKLYIF